MEENVTEKSFKDLEFVRVIQPLMLSHIPKHLFEQVKDRTFDIDILLKLSQEIISNPSQLFYVLVNKDNEIKGVFWISLNVLSNCIDVNLFSIDKEYQFAEAMKEALILISTIQKNATVRVLETRTKALEEIGFKKTKTMMIIENTEI